MIRRTQRFAARWRLSLRVMTALAGVSGACSAMTFIVFYRVVVMKKPAWAACRAMGDAGGRCKMMMMMTTVTTMPRLVIFFGGALAAQIKFWPSFADLECSVAVSESNSHSHSPSTT